MKQTFTLVFSLVATGLLQLPSATAQTNSPQPRTLPLLPPQMLLPAGARPVVHDLPALSGATASRSIPAGPARPLPAHPRQSATSAARPASTSGPVQEAWVARYNASFDAAVDVVLDAAGNAYVTGYSLGNSGYDYVTVKYTATGQLAWEARYTGTSTGDDVPTTVAVDATGNVYVTGSSRGLDGSYDYATLKYSVSGQQLWATRYDGPVSSDALAATLALGAQGQVVVTGTAYQNAQNGYDYSTLVYDGSNGQIRWEARYGGMVAGGDELPAAAAVDEIGNVYVTGSSYANGQSDYATLKYTSSGQLQWERRYNGPANGYELARDLAVDAAGNVAVTGTSETARSYDYATLRYSPLGEVQWTSRYNGPGDGYDEATALTLDAAGNVLVTGYADAGAENWDYVTFKYAALSGQTLWSARYNGPANGFEEARDVAVDSQGNAYVTGRSYTRDGRSEYTTLKYAAASGQALWASRSPNAAVGDQAAAALAVDAAGNVIVTGYAADSEGQTDYATLVYAGASGQSRWSARYNGPAADEQATDLAVDASGNVYVTGSRTLKYAPSGQLLWSAPGGTALAVDATGDVVVTGSGRTTKYDGRNGQLRWQASFALAGRAFVGVDAAGEVYVAGSPPDLNSSQYVVLKYAGSTGQRVWEARYRGTGFRSGSGVADMAVDAAGNVYVTGSVINGNTSDIATLKFSTTGQQLWVVTYDLIRDVEARGLAVDAAGNVAVTGVNVVGINSAGIVTLKYSPAGETLWQAFFGNSSDMQFRSSDIGMDAIGNVFVTGLFVVTSSQYLTLKYSAAGGQPLWFDLYTRPELSYNAATSLAVDVAGNVIVTGISTGRETNADYTTLQYSPTGQRVWEARYNGPANSYDQATKVVVDAARNVYVTGGSPGLGTGLDYATVKYSPTSVMATQTPRGSVAAELAVFPNPVTDRATLRFRPVRGGSAQVRVYNQLGQLVATLYEGVVQPQKLYELPLNSRSLAAGVYHCQLSVGGQYESIRVVVNP
ncbi:SBBP repeat-containing protein [Hymenobacter sp. YC55]|uniref:SBBP repeat-containing protein n=1 Tax=Hymenobacter sp. YC55 TaxID=3034019 RepID=UPI0023F6578F|nr:SBBP repeat-containing protein [Hymenobacter sp. YC55]MDF7813814.1 SBBP repeat-containing protein [Hymenobacter sp. YC55]